MDEPAGTRGTTGDVALDRAYSPYLASIHRRLLASSERPGWSEVDGTLVFADVSGFTPLTERLAKLGKVGAEELTDVLNDIFGTLLDRAAEFGGDLLKFGGDALLLLFDGEGHAARACSAALAMQGALRPYRQLRTAGGTVSLRMSVGVNSGPILFLLVGTTHQELLVAGPTMSRLVELESAADAGEVLVGAGTAASVDRRWLSEKQKDGGTLLRRSVRVLPPPAEVLTPSPVDHGAAHAVDGIPLQLRDHLALPREEGEHRVAVLTFLQFKGVDGLLTARGPAAVRDVLHELVGRVQEACAVHDVFFLATDLDKDGGKVLLAAGAPTASEDDEDRTLAAVLDILEGAPPDLAVRAGVNRGRAFAVDIGNERRRTYAVMGDPTNLAARVMGKAPVGGLLATTAVLDHVRSNYDLVVLEPFMVKGKSHPISASHVRRALARPARRTAPATTVVGREHERTVLERAVAGARRGHGRVVELVAEPGMGKSSLVGHLLGTASGMTRFLVEGAHYAASSPYLSLRGAVRRALTGLDAEIDDLVTLRLAVSSFAPHLEPQLPLLGSLFGLELPDTPETAAIDPTFRRSRVHAVAAELLRAALPEPTVLVVEDAHWLDEASADLLSVLLASAADRPWAVCLTRRPGDSPVRRPPESDVLELAPLPLESARTLIQSTSSHLPPSTVARLIERSGGNPLFLQELVSAIERGQDVDALPDSVEATIASRIDALPPPDRTALRHAAVLGGRFTVSVLADLLDVPEPEAEAMVRRLEGFLEQEEQTCRFRHALVRECAYEGLPFRRRRALHARAGHILERRQQHDLDEWSDLLSLHFSMAGDDERSWKYSKRAGDRARRAFAPVEAGVFYERAADAAKRLPSLPPSDVARLYELLGDCARYSGSYAGAMQAYGRARRAAATDPIRLADLHRKEGMVRERAGRLGDALRWYDRGRRVLLEHLDADRAALAVDAQLTLFAGAARLRQGRYLDCIPLLEAAAALAERLGDRETLAHAYDLLDWAHTDLGNDERHRYRGLSLPIYEELGNLLRQGVVASNLGIDAYFEGRWEEALRRYEQGRAASERAGDVVQMATAINNLGEVESDQGHLEQARARFELAHRIWSEAPFPIGVALATSNLGRVEVRAGHIDGAAALLAEARRDFARIGADSYVIETDVREVERLVVSGDAPEAALALATDVARRSQRAGGLALQMLPNDRAAAYALAQLGRLDEAIVRLQQVASAAEGLGATYELALTDEALGRILGVAGAHQRAEAHCSAAAARLAELGVVRTPQIPLVVVATA